MQVRLWGTRGSIPAPGPQTNRYGGETSCVDVLGPGGTYLILDGGSGMRILSSGVPDSVRVINILLTHLHMDHIQGLGFFPPLRVPGYEVHIWGPAGSTVSLRDRLSRYLSPPLFPVFIRDMASAAAIHEVARQTFEIGEFKISSDPVIHHDPTVGYRIESEEAILTYIPDHEPALGAPSYPMDPDWTSGYELAAGADLLIHDAQYSAEEYTTRKGWGHSSIPDAFEFATLTGARHFVPFHHDPWHSDQDLDHLLGEQSRAHKLPFKMTPAADGLAFNLG